MKAGEIFQFGEFQIDARARTLRREEKKAYVFRAARERQSSAATLPYFLRSVELDPNFARGSLAEADRYHNLGKPGRANEDVIKAFRLREHVESAGIIGIHELI
jgi:hypothetical protein